jgi:hypothetical protein
MFIYIFFAAFFIIEIYKTLYPNEYNVILKLANDDINKIKKTLEPKLISFAYNTIYYYSFCEIYVKKIYKITTLFIRPFIISTSKCISYFLKKYNIIDSNKDINNLVMEFFYQGELLTSLNFYKNNKDVNIDKAPIKYDFIVCSDYTTKEDTIKESTAINKICVSNIHHYFEYEFDFEKTNFTFISLQLSYKDNNYNIDLKNDKHNFYFVNNVLDKNFFTYYLKYILNLDNLEKDISYKLELLDQDVNMRYLTENHSIILNKQDYSIINLNDGEDDNEDGDEKYEVVE